MKKLLALAALTLALALAACDETTTTPNGGTVLVDARGNRATVYTFEKDGRSFAVAIIGKGVSLIELGEVAK